MKWRWGVYIIPHSWLSFEACIKLSSFYRIYIRRRPSEFVKKGLPRWIFEPGWVEYCGGIDDPKWKFMGPPKPDRFTKLVSWFVPPLKRRINMYDTEFFT